LPITSEQGRTISSKPRPRTPGPRVIWLAFFLFGVLSVTVRAQPTDSQPTDDLFIVLLRGPSVVEELLADRGREGAQTRRALRRDPSIPRRTEVLVDSQEALVDRVAREATRFAPPGRSRFEVVGRCTFVVNALFIRADPEVVERLRRDPEVLAVRPSELRVPLLDHAAQVVQADALWEAVGGFDQAGEGVKIGIVDSGINLDHPMFGDAGMTPPPQGFPMGQTHYTNKKVIVARSFHREFTQSPTSVDLTPVDQLGHGSRVAAAAAGRRVEAPLGTVQGIAPMAHLGNYKVFGRQAFTTSAAVTAAIEEAARDGMDVINLSLGGSRRHPVNDPEQMAIANAVAAGIVVVVAAGNRGPDAATVTSPGTSPDAITVGAVSHSRAFLPGIEIDSDPQPPSALIPYAPGQGITIIAEAAPWPILPVELTGDDVLDTACVDPPEPGAPPQGDPPPANSLNGRVALVRRGDCFFQEKADRVFAAGALAMVVYDHIDGPLLTMAFERTPPGPAVLITRRDGEELRTFYLDPQNPQVTVRFRRHTDVSAFPTAGDIVGAFSGRGPGTDGSVKPDLVAVGSGVYTASHSDDEFVVNVSGTSFATPMVAGAAALLKQLHPDWTPRAIKSALVSTALKTSAENGQPARVNEMGNGRLDLSRAARVTAMVDPVGVSLGTHVGSRFPDEPHFREVTLTNLDAQPRSYALAYETTVENPSVRIEIDPSQLTLAPGEEETVRVTAVYSAPLAGGPHEGFLVIGDDMGGPLLTAPVWHQLIVADPHRVLTVSRSGAHEFTSIEAAIRVARPGNVVEIADSETYPVEIILETNQDGDHLHGLTIRARPGQTPILEGNHVAGESAVLLVRELERVTIEGLRVRGGLRGIHFSSAGGVIRDCVVEASGDSDGANAILLESSRVHLFGNQVTGGGGGAVNVNAGQALLQGNLIVGKPDAARPGPGVRATNSDSVGLFDNRLVDLGAEEDGQAVFLADSRAILKGNLIAGVRGANGDAVRARGSAATIHTRDNLLVESDRAGIHIQLGAVGFLSRDRIRDSGFAGIWATDGSSVTADALMLTDNAAGLLADGESWTRVSNSVFARSASDAIRLAGGASLRLLNSTVVDNAGFGVVIEDSPQALVANSIVSGNAFGDLFGLDASQVVFSLVDENPEELLDLADDRFEPLPGSPAIDQGSDDYVEGPTDLRGHVRIVDGLADGDAAVDIGAVEFASDWTPSLVLPVLSPDPDQFVGLALTNAYSPAEEPAAAAEGGGNGAFSAVRIQGYSAAGQEVDRAEFDLRSLEQRARLVTEILDSPADWIEIQASRPDLVGFTLTGDYSQSRLDGFALSSRPAVSLVFPEVRTGADGATTLFLVNPHPSEEPILIRWVPPAGSSEEPLEVGELLVARGLGRYELDDLFPGAEDGYVTVEMVSGRPFFGMELFGTAAAVAGLTALDRWETATTLYGAQLAVAEGIDTIVNLINLGPADDVHFEAVGESGETLAEIVRHVEGGRALREAASSLLGLSDFVGWLRVRSTSAGLLGALQGSLTFADPAGRFSAALPLQSRGARESILSHVAQTADIFTGVTLLNPDLRPALISLEVFDEEGTRVGLALEELPGLNKRALLLPEWIPGLVEQAGGFIRIRSNRRVMGFELFGSGEYLAAVPQQVVVH
jgi:minor extracellular serine protease Vpr